VRFITVPVTCVLVMSLCVINMLCCLCAALMFSATFRKRVERVARDILTDPLRVVQGDAGEVIVSHQFCAVDVVCGNSFYFILSDSVGLLVQCIHCPCILYSCASLYQFKFGKKLR